MNQKSTGVKSKKTRQKGLGGNNWNYSRNLNLLKLEKSHRCKKKG